jgi:Uncharacterized protein conserved in bacteria (DUF2090)
VSLGYNRPLYLLPFDHRQSYVTGMFHFTPPLTADEHDLVAGSKQVIYEGFRQALGEGVPAPHAGILVDEEFGAGILRDAIEHDYVTALSTEKSGSDEFEFEYGTAFAEHIKDLRANLREGAGALQPGGRRGAQSAPDGTTQTAVRLLSDCRTTVHVRAARASDEDADGSRPRG